MLLRELSLSKGAAKRAIFKAKDAERKKFCEDLEREDGKENVFRLAKQLVSKKQRCCECELCEG